MKILFSLIIVCLFSFKTSSTIRFSNMKPANSDSSILVSVHFNGIAGSPIIECGVIMVKVDYEFKLASDSRYAVKSKDGIIRIEFTCPKENGFGFFVKEKLYKFKIKPIYQSKILKEETYKTNNIPRYEYLGRY